LDSHPCAEDEARFVDIEGIPPSEEGGEGEEVEDQAILHHRETTKERSLKRDSKK